MMKWFHLLPLLIPLALSACGDGTYSDLDQFIRDSGKGLHGKVAPPPAIKPYEYYSYNAFDIPDPFNSLRIRLMKGEGGGLQPDFKRREERKEFLENFPLESLKMVGSLQQNKAIYALIRAPDSTLHRVKVGDYLGQDFGLITAVLESEIRLKENVQDSNGDWAERVSTLMLEDQEVSK